MPIWCLLPFLFLEYERDELNQIGVCDCAAVLAQSTIPASTGSTLPGGRCARRKIFLCIRFRAEYFGESCDTCVANESASSRGQPHLRLTAAAKGASRLLISCGFGVRVQLVAQFLDGLEHERHRSCFELLVCLFARKKVSQKRHQCRTLETLLHHQLSPDRDEQPGKVGAWAVSHIDLRDGEIITVQLDFYLGGTHTPPGNTIESPGFERHRLPHRLVCCREQRINPRVVIRPSGKPTEDSAISAGRHRRVDPDAIARVFFFSSSAR